MVVWMKKWQIRCCQAFGMCRAGCWSSLMQCRFKSELDFDLWPARSIKYIVYTYTYIRNWCYEINHIIALFKHGWKLLRSYTKEPQMIEYFPSWLYHWLWVCIWEEMEPGRLCLSNMERGLLSLVGRLVRFYEI